MKVSLSLLARFSFVMLLCCAVADPAKAIRVKAKKADGNKLLVTSDAGTAIASKDGTQSVKLSGSSAQVFTRDADAGTFSGPVVVAIKNGNKVMPYAKAVKKSVCGSDDAVAVLGVKKGRSVPKNSSKKDKRNVVNLGRLVEAPNSGGFFYAKRKVRKSQLDLDATAPVNPDCTLVANASNLGLSATSEVATLAIITATEGDTDGDGLPNELDIDADNDGILNPYDSDFSLDEDKTFRIFSNLKVDIANVVNLHAGEVDDDSVDNLLSSTATLAVQVVASEDEALDETSELNCGGLTYCSADGTGMTLSGNEAFPGEAGGSLDSDGDGHGTITRGGTGDFQLRPGADADAIGAGDTYLQIVTDSEGTETTSLGMLNFIFNTTPALKSIAVNEDAATEISYPIGQNGLGTANNCFSAPAAGDISLTLTAWRPQRKGITGADEPADIDIGNSRIVIDIPNAPCTGSGGCSGSGSGTCGGDNYTSTDTNLMGGGEGFLDTLGDVEADPENTFTFTVDVSGCLDDDSIAWNAGEKVFLDLQLKNAVGDNSAVKFCVERDE